MIRLPLQIALTFLLLVAALPGQAQVIKLSGADLGPLAGEPSQPYRFFRYRNNRMEPIPHQWMAMTDEGLPWFSSDERSSRVGEEGRINAEDQLLLRLADAGDKLDRAVSEQVVGELMINDGGGERYFYVVRNAFQQSTQRYIRFDQDANEIKSTHYSLSMAPDNMLIWKDFFYRGYRDQHGRQSTILDTMKLRLSAGILGDRQRINLTNDNLSPRIEEVVEGPLAVTMYVTTSVRVARVPILRVRNYFVVMPNQVDIHSRFTLPGAASAVLSRPAMSFSLDGNALYGGRLRTSWTGRLEGVVDGELSRDEQAMLEQPMTGERNWLHFSTGRNFDMLAELAFLEGFDAPVKLIYQDDATLENPPERFPGQLPNVGFSIEDIPIGEDFYFVARMMFSGDSDGLSAERYATRMLSEPEIRFSSM